MEDTKEFNYTFRMLRVESILLYYANNLHEHFLALLYNTFCHLNCAQAFTDSWDVFFH